MKQYKDIAKKIIYSMVLLLSFVLPSIAEYGRIEISQQMTPYTITNSGSYVLTEDVHSLSNAVITVHADMVTLDLNNYTVSLEDIFGNAIIQSESNQCLTVHNGRIKSALGYAVYAQGKYNKFFDLECYGFGFGGITTGVGSMIINCKVTEGYPVPLNMTFFHASDGSIVLDCIGGSVSNSSGGVTGVSGGDGLIVKGCSIIGNEVGNEFVGISISNGCVVTDCLVFNNKGATGARGILAGSGNVITDCRLSNNYSTNSNEYGIYVQDGTVISSCSISATECGIRGSNANVVAHCVVKSTMRGIKLHEDSIVRDNSVSGGGIEVFKGCLVAESTVHNASIIGGYDAVIIKNNIVNSGVGIQVQNFSRVDLNHIDANPDVDAGGFDNLVIRNYSPSFNTLNTSDDQLAQPRIGSANYDADEPWANISQ